MQEYSREKALRDTRWFLVLLGLVQIVYGIINYLKPRNQDNHHVLYGSIAVAILYFIGAALKFYWLRFALIISWVAGLIADLFLQKPINQGKIIYIFVGFYLIHLLWKNRN